MRRSFLEWATWKLLCLSLELQNSVPFGVIGMRSSLKVKFGNVRSTLALAVLLELLDFAPHITRSALL